jgi:hypothetical protein
MELFKSMKGKLVGHMGKAVGECRRFGLLGWSGAAADSTTASTATSAASIAASTAESPTPSQLGEKCLHRTYKGEGVVGDLGGCGCSGNGGSVGCIAKVTGMDQWGVIADVCHHARKGADGARRGAQALLGVVLLRCDDRREILDSVAQVVYALQLGEGLPIAR